MKKLRFARLFLVVFLLVGIGNFLHPDTSDQDADATSVTTSNSESLTRQQPIEVVKSANREVRVGIQVGHWKNGELPDEFARLRVAGGGTTVGAITEWGVCLEIAELIATQLEVKGVIVDMIPATIPIDYEADAFVSIHADGNEDTSVSGFKVAAYTHDTTGNAELLSSLINASYAKATGIKIDSNVTDAMTQYYAFNSSRYDHAISSTTPGVIVETGFLTSASDRRTIVAQPEKSAQGIANGIIEYLVNTGEF